jgi:hypothetical protein
MMIVFTLWIMTQTTMTASSVQALSFRHLRLYSYSSIFVLANVSIPLLFHQEPGIARMLLPIYFFSLVGALRYGWKCGVLTALLSPLVSFGISGMPLMAILPFVMFKSVILAGVAGMLSGRYGGRFIYMASLAAVFITQTTGSLLIFGITGNPVMAMADMQVGWVGLGLQMFLAPRLADLRVSHEA